MKDTVNAAIQAILKSRRGITANQVLVDDLGFDSLKLFELIAQLEDEFDTALSFREAQRIRTVGDLYRYLEASFPEGATA